MRLQYLLVRNRKTKTVLWRPVHCHFNINNCYIISFMDCGCMQYPKYMSFRCVLWFIKWRLTQSLYKQIDSTCTYTGRVDPRSWMLIRIGRSGKHYCHEWRSLVETSLNFKLSSVQSWTPTMLISTTDHLSWLRVPWFLRYAHIPAMSEDLL